MSYTVHNFTAGDIIHAADLNEMDEQIAANAEGGAVNIDDTLTIAGAAADAKKVGDEITDLKADLSNAVKESLVLNTSDIIDSYIKTPTVGKSITYASSTASKVIKKIIPVIAGSEYTIKITEAASPASAASRQCVIADNFGVITQIFSYTNAAGSETIVPLSASTDGYMYITVDKNYVSIDIDVNFITDAKKLLPALQHDLTDTMLDTIDLNSWIGKNLYNPNSVTPGRILLSDGSLSKSTDLFASDYIPISENTRYIVTPQISSSTYGAAFYDSNKIFISSMSLTGTGTNGYYPIVFVAPAGSAFFRFSIWHTYVPRARLYEYSLEVFQNLLPRIPVLGSPISLNPSVNIRKQFTTGLSRRQGGAVYNGKLFSVNENLTACYLIDLFTGAKTAVTLTDELTSRLHANTVYFGKVFYDNSDEFPVVYISGEGQPGFCGVFRITENNGEYFISLLVKIHYPSTSEMYYNLLIDTERNLMFLRGFLPEPYNNFKGFVKYDLLNTFTEDVSLEYVEKSSEHPFGYIDYVRYYPRFVDNQSTQDSFIHGGQYYGVMGVSNTACFNVIDMETGRLLSFIDLTQYTSAEVESCDLYDNSILLMTAGGEIHFAVPSFK